MLLVQENTWKTHPSALQLNFCAKIPDSGGSNMEHQGRSTGSQSFPLGLVHINAQVLGPNTGQPT